MKKRLEQFKQGLITKKELDEFLKILRKNNIDGFLHSGMFYDYKNQAWIKDGKYICCAHPESMNCGCYGRTHAGKDVVLKD